MVILMILRTLITSVVRRWTISHHSDMQAEINLRVVEVTLQHRHQGAPNAEVSLPQPTRKQWTFKEIASVYTLCMYVNTGGNAMEQTARGFVLQWRREMMGW